MAESSVMETEPQTRTLLRQDANRLVETAREFQISSVETRDAAVSYRGQIKETMYRIDQFFDPPRDKIWKAFKAAKAQKDVVYQPCELADKIMDRKITDYNVAERKRVEDERRRLDAEARKQEEDRRLEEAAHLEAGGHKEEAAAIIDEPIVVAPVHVEAPPKMEGSHLRTTWKHEVIKADLVPRDWCMPDDRKLADYARRMKEGASVPGVRFYPEHSTTTRRSGV